MATTASEGGRKLSVVRLALTGAIAAGIFFLLCWVGAFLPIGPATHAYIQLFTNAEMGTALALVQGLCWSLVFGLVAGTLVALVYNALGALDRG